VVYFDFDINAPIQKRRSTHIPSTQLQFANPLNVVWGVDLPMSLAMTSLSMDGWV